MVIHLFAKAFFLLAIFSINPPVVGVETPFSLNYQWEGYDYSTSVVTQVPFGVAVYLEDDPFGPCSQGIGCEFTFEMGANERTRAFSASGLFAGEFAITASFRSYGGFSQVAKGRVVVRPQIIAPKTLHFPLILR